MIQASATLDDLRLRPHWSYSAINQFLRICPAQFAFQRVHKLKSAFVTETLPFGSAFHRTAEYFWHRRAEGQNASADELADLFARLWRREVDETQQLIFQKGDVESLSAQGKAMMKAYREGADDLGEVVGVNVPFAIPLVDSDGVVLDRPIIGEFDLLLAGPGESIICVDLKTAAQRYSDAKLTSGPVRVPTTGIVRFFLFSYELGRNIGVQGDGELNKGLPCQIIRASFRPTGS